MCIPAQPFLPGGVPATRNVLSMFVVFIGGITSVKMDFANSRANVPLNLSDKGKVNLSQNVHHILPYLKADIGLPSTHAATNERNKRVVKSDGASANRYGRKPTAVQFRNITQGRQRGSYTLRQKKGMKKQRVYTRHKFRYNKNSN